MFKVMEWQDIKFLANSLKEICPYFKFWNRIPGYSMYLINMIFYILGNGSLHQSSFILGCRI